ncbi:MAG: hypothetical protein M8858_08160 [marine benthic group bacterium]|nr:hypothetical protein [Gemmatimonadota bacterium]
MTVPFRPGGVDPGLGNFTDTLTRAFTQAYNLVEEDRQRKRDAARFQTEMEKGKLANEMLAQRLDIEAKAEGRAARGAAIGEAASGVVTRPTAENPLADALQGGQEPLTEISGTAGTPEDLIPVEGQPGTFIDRNFERRELERNRAQEAQYVEEQIEQAAMQAEAAGDLEEAQRLRDAKPRAVLDVHQGRQPDTAALLLARERRTTPTAAQQERIDRQTEQDRLKERTQQEDAAIERALQQDAHRQLQELGDPAGAGDYVHGRDYERQLQNARTRERAAGGAGADEPETLTLRDALRMVKDDASVWDPNQGYKIPLRDVVRRAEALVESSIIRTGTRDIEGEGGEPVAQIEIPQEYYDGVVAEMGEDYARTHFKVKP